MSAFLRTDSTDTMGKWERALCALHDIGRSTITRNIALQQDLDSVKKSYETALAELHYRQVAVEMHNTQIICAIDGSTFIFDQIFLRRGPAGARDAIKALTQAVTDHLVALPTPPGKNPILWINIYLNRPLLAEDLVSKGICTADQFDTFLTAFSMTNARFSIIDVTGDRKYIRDKLLAFCQTSLLLPTTLHVFAACQDPDVGFALATMGSHNLTFFEHTQNRWSVPSLPAAIVFMEEGLPSSSWSPPTPIGSVCTSGGLPSPLSPMSCYSNTPIQSCDPLLDPSLPLNKQNPPPCNEYYLMKTGCSKGSTCKYAHNYRLTEDQLALLAQSAKKAPCNNVKNGSHCPYGEECCWGHSCPKGKDCPYKSKGKCWFKGDELHVSDYYRT